MNLHRVRHGRGSGPFLAFLAAVVLLAAGCSDGGTETSTPTAVTDTADDGEGGGPRSANDEDDGDDPAATTPESVELEVGEYTFDAIVAGPDDGAAVFLLHGFPQTNQSWDDVIPVLAEAGYRVVAPNLRGYSPGARPPEPELYTMDHHMTDVLGMADALGVDQFHAVGHDWGASVTWALGMSHPDRVLSIVPLSVAHPQAIAAALTGSAPPVEDERSQTERFGYMAIFAAEGAEDTFLENDAAFLRRLFSGPGFTEEEVQDYVDHFNEPGAMTGALNWIRARGSGMQIEPVTIPTMYVWSTEDPALGRTGAELTVDYVEGPYRFEILEGVSHWIPDEAPVELNALLLEHLETHS